MVARRDEERMGREVGRHSGRLRPPPAIAQVPLVSVDATATARNDYSDSVEILQKRKKLSLFLMIVTLSDDFHDEKTQIVSLTGELLINNFIITDTA